MLSFLLSCPRCFYDLFYVFSLSDTFVCLALLFLLCIMPSQVTKNPSGHTDDTSSQSDSSPLKGFVVLMGIEGRHPDEVVRTLVQLRKEKGWSSRLFSLHSLPGSEGLYEEWCSKMSSEVRRLRVASAGSSLPQKEESSIGWERVVPGQFDDAASPSLSFSFL